MSALANNVVPLTTYRNSNAESYIESLIRGFRSPNLVKQYSPTSKIEKPIEFIHDMFTSNLTLSDLVLKYNVVDNHTIQSDIGLFRTIIAKKMDIFYDSLETVDLCLFQRTIQSYGSAFANLQSQVNYPYAIRRIFISMIPNIDAFLQLFISSPMYSITNGNMEFYRDKLLNANSVKEIKEIITSTYILTENKPPVPENVDIIKTEFYKNLNTLVSYFNNEKYLCVYQNVTPTKIVLNFKKDGVPISVEIAVPF